MITLGIETSCDETSAAIIDNGKKLSNVVTSSVHLHTKYGGVVPEIASRYHLEYIDQVIKESLVCAKKKLSDIELIAVTYGPGLCGSLLTGLAYAKALAFGLSIDSSVFLLVSLLFGQSVSAINTRYMDYQKPHKDPNGCEWLDASKGQRESSCHQS